MFKLLLALLFTVIVSVPAFSSSKPTIGVVLNPNGRFGNVRQPIINAIKLFFENKKDVNVEYFEGGDSLEEQRKVAKEISDKEIRFIIGHNSSKISKQFLVSLPKNYETLYISPLATSMELLDINEGVHIFGPNNKLQISTILNSIRLKRPKRVLMIVNESETYSSEMARLFEEKSAQTLGMVDIERISYVKNKFTPKKIIDEAMKHKPDAIFAPIYSYDLVVLYNYFLEKYSDSTPKPNFFSGDTIGRKNVVYGKLGANKNKLTGNMSFTANWVPEMKSTQSREFIKNYQNKFGEFPPSAAAAGHDTAMVLHGALKESGSKDPATVKKQLQKMRFSGVVGDISFSENRTSIRPVPLLKLTKDGYRYYGKF